MHYGHSSLNPKSSHEAGIVGPISGTALRPCFPNPFNPSTTIEFALGKSGPAKLGIYNLDGKLVRELVSANLEVGSHQYVWNGNDSNGGPVASGVYLYRLVTQDETLTKRMMLLK